MRVPCGSRLPEAGAWLELLAQLPGELHTTPNQHSAARTTGRGCMPRSTTCRGPPARGQGAAKLPTCKALTGIESALAGLWLQLALGPYMRLCGCTQPRAGRPTSALPLLLHVPVHAAQLVPHPDAPGHVARRQPVRCGVQRHALHARRARLKAGGQVASGEAEVLCKHDGALQQAMQGWLRRFRDHQALSRGAGWDSSAAPCMLPGLERRHPAGACPCCRG